MHYPMHHAPAAPPPRRDPEATRKLVGWILYWFLLAIGALLFGAIFFVSPLFSKHADVAYHSLWVGICLALPMLLIYLWVPWIVDRFDPEPLWALMTVLAWGAIAGCGYGALINTMFQGIVAAITGDEQFADAAGACISAPIVEEGVKGLAVFWIFYFQKREFDGVVDGIIYATFAALGFAAFENIVYYARASDAQILEGKDGALATTFFLRGILAPWGHPLYTAMTGIGFGIARETEKTWVRWLAPLGGYCAAVFLHFVWNFAATVSGMLMLVMLPLWLLFVVAFLGMLVWLVARKGKIIRKHLEDEVLLGNMTPYELDLVSSPFGSFRATMSYGGSLGRKFITAASRLGLSKWHAGRAARGRKMTVSADFVLPLRRELHDLRARIQHAVGRPIPMPQAWDPSQAPRNVHPQQQHHPQQGYPQHGYPPNNPWGRR